MVEDLVGMLNSQKIKIRQLPLWLFFPLDYIRKRDTSTIHSGKIGKYEVFVYTHFLNGEIDFQNLFVSYKENPVIFYTHSPQKGDGALDDLRSSKTDRIPPDIAVNRILMSYLN